MKACLRNMNQKEFQMEINGKEYIRVSGYEPGSCKKCVFD